MKDKLKKIITIIFIVFAILFGFSWVKSCNNVKDIKTYENVAQMRQKAPKKANEQEDNKDYIIFDSNIIEKVEMGQEEFIADNDKVTIDLWYFPSDYQYDLKIYFKKGYAYQETTNINDNFILSTLNNEDIAFTILDYKNSYNYSTMHIDYEFNEDIAQVTTITLKNELIKHNFDYLTNKSLILNSSLSSQFGYNLLNISDASKTTNGVTYSITDGVITLNGTSTSTFDIDLGTFNLDSNTTYSFNNIGGAYSGITFNTFRDGTYANIIQMNNNNNPNGWTSKGYTTYRFVISIANGNNFNNVVLKPMFVVGSYSLPFHKYIDISQNNDRVRLLTKDNSLNDRTYATYFYSNSNKQLIPKEDLIPIIAIENNKLGFAIGTGTQTTNQPIFDYSNRVYLNGYGFIPRTLVFTNQFNHDNINCFVLNNYQEGYADYDNEILFTEYLLNNSQPFTTEQIDTYNIGYQVGKSDGIYQALEWTNLIKQLAISLESFLNIQILPNITIKLLILVPIMFSILNFIIKLFTK